MMYIFKGARLHAPIISVPCFGNVFVWCRFLIILSDAFIAKVIPCDHFSLPHAVVRSRSIANKEEPSKWDYKSIIPVKDNL